MEIAFPLVSFLVLDYIWLGHIQAPMYKKVVRGIQGSELEVNYTGAIAAYLLMVAVVWYTVKSSHTQQEAIVKSALAGLAVYGIFNGTNHAIFKEWGHRVSVMDTLWGTFLFGLVGGATWYVTRA